MQVCERILTKCGSSSPGGKTLIPAVLGVVDHQLGFSHLLPAAQHTSSSPSKSPNSSFMAQSASLLLSPSKRPFCSSASSGSPVRMAMVMSPSSASKAKRPLADLQCCVNSSNIPALSTCHQHNIHAAGASRENARPSPHHTAKRLEVAQGRASKPRQPVTPLVSQPEPLAAGLHPTAQLTPPAATPAPPAADTAADRLSAAAAAAAAADVLVPARAGISLLLGGHDGRAYSDQLPSPCTILEVPPALVASASTATQPDVQAASEVLLRKAQAGPQAPPKHIMSGKRIAEEYDVPVNISFLDTYADHQPAVGSGRLDVIVGPMFAGKTTALLQKLQQVVADRPFICVKSSKDTRYAHFWATTHGGKSVRCVPFHSLAEFKAHMGFRWHKLQVIAIDEAQFFPDLVEFCTEAVDNYGKHVIVAGLSGDFRRRRFGQVLDLLPLADSVEQLKSICSVCGGKHGPGLFSLRKAHGGPQEVVGGDETYMATCRRCYLENGGQTQ